MATSPLNDTSSGASFVNSPVNDTTAGASWTTPGAGITGGYNGNNETLRIFIVFFAGLGMYNACEVIIILFLTFHAYKGLYFWSVFFAGLGVFVYDLGFLIKFMNFMHGNGQWFPVVLLTLGWYPMITAQSLVLWSRLNLIVSGETGDKILKYTKWMIIIDAIVFHIPTSVFTFGANGRIRTAMFVSGYSIVGKSFSRSIKEHFSLILHREGTDGRLFLARTCAVHNIHH
jgi:hypothetical protein